VSNEANTGKKMAQLREATAKKNFRSMIDTFDEGGKYGVLNVNETVGSFQHFGMGAESYPLFLPERSQQEQNTGAKL
jgi:hypothetical protein